MKLFLVKRIDEVEYNEYKAFVVRAENKENSLFLCNAFSLFGKDVFRNDNTEITEISSEGEEEVVLCSLDEG